MASSSPVARFFIFFAIFVLKTSISAALSIDTDKQALMAIKSGFKSLPPSNPLSSWDQSSSPCNWTRVSCSNNGERVVALDLSNLKLAGPVDPQIGNLSFLRSLQLQNNLLTGSIPGDVRNLFRLKVLNMSFNSINGGLPSNISSMASLETLDLTANKITGTLPEELSRLKNLKVLKMAQNHLYGDIPTSFGNLSSLVTLDLGTNSLSGSIPSQLGGLPNLKDIIILINQLTGTIPSSIFNMSSLVTLTLASNKLRGTFPADIGEKLPNLLVFNLCFNEFTGTYPQSLHNITGIEVIRFAYNFLEGTVPPGLENLRNLSMYNIGYNRFVTGENGLDFITSLTRSSRLAFLALDGNNFHGGIPDSIGNLSKTLSKLYMGGNRLSGKIPPTIGDLSGLTLLNLSYNSLSGEIPPQIGNLENLQMLGLAKNKFSGRIPNSLGNLRKMNEFDLSGNDLNGDIPSSFGNFQNLLSIDISSNKLNSTIPKEALNFPSLSKILNFSNNLLTGPLPQELGLLENVVTIDISSNRISGAIPPSLRGCRNLEKLTMARNEFSGPIPKGLGELKGLRSIDLSSNHLSGSIPESLQNLHTLLFLNLSYNDLEGVVPNGGVFKNMANVDLEGNPKLCLDFSCSKSNRSKTVKIIAFTAAFSSMALCVVFGMMFYFTRRKSKTAPSSDQLLKVQHELVTYDELRFATGNFSQENLVGKGSFGSVYKGHLRQGAVAVKVLHTETAGSVRSFLAECEALRNVRHRNLVKLITSCSSVDFSNKDFRALVYEFLSNGALSEWISGHRSHGNGNGLDLLQRLNIAIDVASVVDYLHHDCELPVVHCDLKPSNILLDADMTAKVGDFGLARMLIESSSDQSSITSTHVLKGSIGYVPPEYGYGGRPTVAGDVYSFGVTLLELFTGKSPTDECFTGELNLVKWVESVFPDDVMEVVDCNLVELGVHMQYEGRRISANMQKECAVKIIEVGLSCTVDPPVKRISARDAVSKLKSAKKSLLHVK